MEQSAPISNRAKGDIGEDVAQKFLVDKGYKILKRNFNFGKSGEIDIIATDGDVIVFVEVKSRKANSPYGDPLFSINYAKQKNMRKAASGFLYVNKIQNKDCRFDVIIIINEAESTKIEHLINVM